MIFKILNNMNFRNNVIIKKGYRYLMNILRFFINNFPNQKLNLKILCNSFPKSGTYLLFSILKSIPGVKDWGNFIASKPSLSYLEKSPERIEKKIKFLVPMEIVAAHVFYNKDVYQILLNNNCIMFFIYRDPRDIVISEANYLYDMNRYHRLHKYFKKFPDLNDRIMFSIKGDEFYKTPIPYLNIKDRFNKYKEWMYCKDVFSIRYEDLINNEKEEYIKNIINFYKEHSSNNNFNTDLIVKKAIKNSEPKKSHTYRTGKSEGWKKIFTEEHKKVFKDIAGDLLIELGYEKDLNW